MSNMQINLSFLKKQFRDEFRCNGMSPELSQFVRSFLCHKNQKNEANASFLKIEKHHHACLAQERNCAVWHVASLVHLILLSQLRG